MNIKGKKKEKSPIDKNEGTITLDNQPVAHNVLVQKQKKAFHVAYLFNSATAYRYKLANSVTRIGRDRRNDVVIADDPYVSRNHAWILENKIGFWVEDLGSANTTLLNGQPVKERHRINNGDKLVFGKTNMTFFAEN